MEQLTEITTGRATMEAWAQKAKDSDKSDEYSMHNAVGLSASMLVEFAEECKNAVDEGMRWGFPSSQSFVSTMLGLKACEQALRCIAEAMPTKTEVLEDILISSTEQLEVMGMSFTDLFDFYCDNTEATA